MKELTLEEKVTAFQALKTHAEKCAYFDANPELGRIFGAHHFAKSETAEPHHTIVHNQK